MPLDAATLDAAAASPLSRGIVAGLVGGKLLGITLGALGAVRLRWGTLPPGLGTSQVAGGAALSGIGFTISLFIVDLALDDPVLQDHARVGVLAASLLAALIGWLIFHIGQRRGSGATGATRPVLLDRPVDRRRDHIRGAAEAPLTLLEYGDFECPFCGRATGSIEEDLHRGVHAARVQADAASAETSGAEGTPTFFIDDRRHNGPHDAATLIRALTASEAARRSANGESSDEPQIE